MNRIYRRIAGLFLALVLLSSCFQEESNLPPTIHSYSISKGQAIAGDLIEITIHADDPDGDPIYYGASSEFCHYEQKNSTNNTFNWLVPNYEGEIEFMLEVSDRKTTVDEVIVIQSIGSLKESFETGTDGWTASNCYVEIQEDICKIEPSSEAKDALLYYELNQVLSPPYQAFMELELDHQSTSFTSDDRYGMYLNFYNAGSDTLIKALWFRVYPNSSSKNWKVSVLKDFGNSNKWSTLVSSAYGTSDLIVPGENAKLITQLIIDENLNLQIFLNEELLFESDVLMTEYLTNGEPPLLRLEKLGARTTSGTLSFDDVFITQDLNIRYTDIFTN